MDNKEFKDLIDELLKPFGFKKRNNYWRVETDEIEKVIYLQKSNYSNMYYINYGYNLKKLDHDGFLIHIFNRLSQSDTFDLEKNIDFIDRHNKIKQIFVDILIPDLNKINKESDICDLLKSRPHLNDIPLKVKDYLGLKT